MRAGALAWVLTAHDALGLPVPPELRASPEEPEAEVPIAAYAGLLRGALDREPAFAMKAGTVCPFGTFPLLDYTNAACDTFANVVGSLVRYFSLVSTTLAWRLDGARLVLEATRPLPDWLRAATQEFTLTYTAHRFLELMGPGAVRAVGFAWPAPAWSSAWPAPLPPPTWNARDCALVLEPRALNRASRRADRALLNVLTRAASAALAASATRVPSTQRLVSEAIVKSLPNGLPAMGDVARQLAMSARTLRRRLDAEGATFEEVRDRVLCELATAHLQDRRRSVEEVAFLLGFSEPRAFHRAFKRWTGRTPRAR